MSESQQENVLIMATWLYEATGDEYSLSALQAMCNRNPNDMKGTPKSATDEDEAAYSEQIEMEDSMIYGQDVVEGKAKWLNVLRKHPMKDELFSFVSTYGESIKGAQSQASVLPEFNIELADKTEKTLETYVDLDITKNLDKKMDSTKGDNIKAKIADLRQQHMHSSDGEKQTEKYQTPEISTKNNSFNISSLKREEYQ